MSHASGRGPLPKLQRPMTLVMLLADPSYAGILALGRVFADPKVGQRLGPDLDRGGTVHFARFVLIDDNLVMASSYDGEFADYIEMFIHTMGDIFDAILGFIADAPPTPVGEHPGEFVDWVHSHDQQPIGFYSGYPEISTQQIRTALGLPTNAADATPQVSPLPAEALGDVQGLILRGFGHPLARHFVLQVLDAATARQALATMGDTAPSADPWAPRVSASSPWNGAQPTVAWALGITATGLLALGVARDDVETFPAEFLAGAPARASIVGDVAANAPEFWDPELTNSANVHVLVSLYAADEAAMERATASIGTVIERAFRIMCSYDAAVFPDAPELVHFGFRDGISQPIVDGDPVVRPNDHQPRAAAGEFVLGYPSQYTNVTLDVPTPTALGRNGSFSAWRVLEQDVVGFETYLNDAATTTGRDAEWLAAKIVGRWRSGVPLALSPDATSPVSPITDADLNDFVYADDPFGLKCPISAHIRRGNPRDQPMTPQGDGHARRIMRRGIPYGPRWRAGDPVDQQPRGLIGHFIGASLLLQFETVMGEWLNRGMTSPSITGTDDALLGVALSEQRCAIPTQVPGEPVNPAGVELTGFPQFVRTRGCVYAFLPSLTALRWLGSW